MVVCFELACALWKIIASVLVVNGVGLRTKVMPMKKVGEIRWRTTHGKESGGNGKTAASLSFPYVVLHWCEVRC